MHRTCVVNVRHQKCDFYGARPSFIGNPFLIGRDGTREEVIEKYREWFRKKLTDSVFRDKVLSLKGKRLGCFCSPDLCHLNVVVNYIEYGTL